MNNKEDIIQKLQSVEKEKTNEADRIKIYEALLLQLSLQNQGISIEELRKELPSLKDGIMAAEGKMIEGKTYKFDRWVITASVGSLRIDAELTQ